MLEGQTLHGGKYKLLRLETVAVARATLDFLLSGVESPGDV